MCLWQAPKVDTPQYPAESQTQQDLDKTQLELAQQNLAINKQNAADEAAGRKKFEELTGQPYADYVANMAKSTQDMNLAYLDRYKKALAGELPVDPGLERSLTEQESTLRANLQRQLGPGWENSTPGQQALAEYKKRAEELRYSAARGEITAGEQQGYAMNPLSWVPQTLKQNDIQTPNQVTDLLGNYRNQNAQVYNAQNLAAMQNAQMKNINDMAFRQQLHEGVMFASQSGMSGLGGM
jgi:hypothetical protein